MVRAASDPNAATRETVIAREKEQFGGIKIGSAFFGWLTATGMAVLLVALVAAAGSLLDSRTTRTSVTQRTWHHRSPSALPGSSRFW
ncbi:hypothetical protein AHiyo8_63160 [Arthrobacter sp. Hiyo8]|nr:hypothetical protein AHiyo8_63160 [Arthrobacter sp. Hiyo8]